MKKCIILYLLFALCCFYAAGQTLPGSIELSSLLTVTQDSTITARNQIWLKPGFRFTAQTSKALYLKIAAGGIRVKHRNHSTGAPLSGGQFRITKANNVLVGNYTVGNGQTGERITLLKQFRLPVTILSKRRGQSMSISFLKRRTNMWKLLYLPHRP